MEINKDTRKLLVANGHVFDPAVNTSEVEKNVSEIIGNFFPQIRFFDAKTIAEEAVELSVNIAIQKAIVRIAQYGKTLPL